jgi:bromodomain-containing protein 7/9
MIANAAKTFNPVGTIPHNAAIKMYNQGVKQIERIRDLVLTPHPSRAGSATLWRDGSVMSGREATAALDDGQTRASKADIPPPSYIPEEMLAYPPNTGAAKMIGWNLNGGKRVYLKKITRGRERFTGKWRMWDLDGTRDVAEMDDPEFYFDAEKTRSGTRSRGIVDWRELRYEKWWDYDGLGGPNGQPPLPGTPLPKRPIARERPLTAFDWGAYPDIDTQMAVLGKRNNMTDETAVLYNHLNAPRVKNVPTAPHNFVNLFEEPQNRQPIDYMREFATGDITGEAYTRSIDRFIQGAIAGRTKSEQAKPDLDRIAEDKKPGPVSIDLTEYVEENYGYGILSRNFEQRPTIRATIQQATELATGSGTGRKHDIDNLEKIQDFAKSSFARTALRQMTRQTNALDIVPLIRIPGEFTWQGIGGKGDIDIGLKWVAEYQAKAEKNLEKRNANTSSPPRKRPRLEEATSAASSPLSAAPGSPVKEPQTMAPTTFDMDLDLTDGENGLKRIRLELLALTKFYPLAALRKMDKAQAEKLLPPNVRALMTNTAKR